MQLCKGKEGGKAGREDEANELAQIRQSCLSDTPRQRGKELPAIPGASMSLGGTLKHRSPSTTTYRQSLAPALPHADRSLTFSIINNTTRGKRDKSKLTV